MAEILVHKNRTTVVRVNLGMDVSGDTFASQIREKASLSSPVIASWVPSFETNGVDGMLLLTLDNSQVMTITAKTGYTDLKRTTGGEPVHVFSPIKV